jgi:DNA-directed RNA polymerase subunit RPC12/RpoP
MKNKLVNKEYTCITCEDSGIAILYAEAIACNCCKYGEFLKEHNIYLPKNKSVLVEATIIRRARHWYQKFLHDNTKKEILDNLDILNIKLKEAIEND